MKRLRMWCALFFAWLFVLYNIERLHEPINIASFVYVLAAVLAVVIVAVPRLQRLPIGVLLACVVPVILGLKWWLGYRTLGRHLPMTVTEVVATWVTIALAVNLARSLEELRQAALATLLTHLRDRTQPFEQGEAELYREIRRARLHDRPLAILAVAPNEDSVTHALDRFTEELQRECARNYVAARVAELLSCEIKECDVITYRGTHFVTVLPEAGRDKAMATIQRLKTLTREKLGIELRVGVSLFPDDEVTLVKLIERAQAGLDGTPIEQLRDDAGGDSSGDAAEELHELLAPFAMMKR